MKTVAFVPIKLNSERLPHKNIKPFTNGEPLIHYILHTLLNVQNIDEIYVYCSSEEIIPYLPRKVIFLKRDPYFDLSTTPFNEVLSSFAKKIYADVYVLTHATAPFLKKESLEIGVNKVKSGKYDSALTVTKMQEFLWKDGRPFNYDVCNIPRTQDLEKYYIETCGLYVYTRNLILHNRRVGEKPFLIEVSKLEAIDINESDDFIVADSIYNSMYRKS